MILEVCRHVAEAHNFGAKMAFCGPSAVYEFVRRETREKNFRVPRTRVVGALLRDFKVAERAKD